MQLLFCQMQTDKMRTGRNRCALLARYQEKRGPTDSGEFDSIHDVDNAEGK